MFAEQWYQLRGYLIRILYARKGKRLQRYSIPLVLVILVFVSKPFFDRYFGEGSPFLSLAFVVYISSWFGGFGPGLCATILSAAFNYYLFLHPILYLPSGANLALSAFFFTEGVLISFINEARHQSEDQKDEFIALVSHELKNPLAAIQGYSTLIKKIAKKNNIVAIPEYSQRIDGNIKKITAIINDLSDITKIEAGKLTYKNESFLIQDLLDEILLDYRHMVLTHSIKLHGKSKKIIHADKYRLGQVLNNIISNAIKYSPDAEKIDVVVKDVVSGTVIKVKDYGVGIGKKEQRKIFERYYRGTAEKSRIQGLGMGLYISSKIVRYYEGKMWFRSKLGKGTTFFLQLPSLKCSQKRLSKS